MEDVNSLQVKSVCVDALHGKNIFRLGKDDVVEIRYNPARGEGDRHTVDVKMELPKKMIYRYFSIESIQFDIDEGE